MVGYFLKLKNSLKITYRSKSFKYFVKSQKYKFIFNKYWGFINKRIDPSKDSINELYRNLDLLFNKLNLYRLSSPKGCPLGGVEFVNDLFIMQLTGYNIQHIDVYNHFNLKHEDLLRTIYVYLLSLPLDCIENNIISLTGVGYIDPDTELFERFSIRRTLTYL